MSLFGWMVLGCFGVYLFVKEWGPGLGIVGRSSLSPFHHLANLHFFLAEFAAERSHHSAVLSDGICRRQSWGYVVPLANRSPLGLNTFR